MAYPLTRAIVATSPDENKIVSLIIQPITQHSNAYLVEVHDFAALNEFNIDPQRLVFFAAASWHALHLHLRDP